MAGCSNYFTRICESYITYKIARHCPPSLLTLPLNFGGRGGGGRGGPLFLFANKKIKLVMMPTYKLGYIVIHQRQQNINNRHWNQVNDCVHTAHILNIYRIFKNMQCTKTFCASINILRPAKFRLYCAAYLLKVLKFINIVYVLYSTQI